MTFFQSSPRLSVLELSGIRFRLLAAHVAEYPLIHLPQLRNLYINDLGYKPQFIFLEHMKAPSCKFVSVHYTVNIATEATSYIPLLHPLVPRNVIPKRGFADLEIGASYLDYMLSLPPTTPYDLSLGIDGAPTSATLSPFFYTLTERLRDLDTHLTLLDDIAVDDVEVLVATPNTLRVTHLAVHSDDTSVPDALLNALTEPLHEGRWVFPALQVLIITSNHVSSGLISRMSKPDMG